jgi:hypothetical protein
VSHLEKQLVLAAMEDSRNKRKRSLSQLSQRRDQIEAEVEKETMSSWLKRRTTADKREKQAMGQEIESLQQQVKHLEQKELKQKIVIEEIQSNLQLSRERQFTDLSTMTAATTLNVRQQLQAAQAEKSLKPSLSLAKTDLNNCKRKLKQEEV